jgi:hypothetical protein
MEHLSRRNTLSTPHNGTSTVLSWTSVKKEYPIHTTQWNITSYKLNICPEGIPYPHHTMQHQQFWVEHLSRRNTQSTPHNGTSTVLSWTAVKMEYPIHTTQWNINSSKLDICQKLIPIPHHTMEHLSRRNTLSTPHNGTSTVLSWTSVKKEYPIHTTQWNINSSELNSCQDGIPYPHHTMEHQQF